MKRFSMLKESLISSLTTCKLSSESMSSQTNIMDKVQLTKLYIKEVIDGMDLNDCLALLEDYMVESYEDYTIEEIKEEVEEYYPHLLED